jgi:DNA-binding transcriptional ArsR family regulator
MDVFAALADPTRRHLVERLAREPDGSLTELSADLPVTRQAVAKHLGALAAAGLVISERRGRETRYRLQPGALRPASAWIDRVGVQWDGRLDRLRRHAESRRA